ncbi:hypothetical protein LSUE1_G000772 [Lachnellula suecica]|uniref:Uncharacterized protein n=1 Tax=Lachnellula suecica TaxID=602035 RepID=A0A8T9CK56_9HELO|nr:hypothetical protein LSUE1_G000772 [Lachnellula suecica]
MSSQADPDVLLEGLAEILLKGSVKEDHNARKEALRLSKALTMALEEPVNAAVDMMFAAFAPMSARIAVDLKLFELISSHEGLITAAQLAALSGGEELLISWFRIPRREGDLF